VGAGSPVVVLADTSSWEIETSDLTEFDVVGVRPGDLVQLTFDAIPDLQLPGTVSRVRPIGEDNRGDTVYKVVVTPTQSDGRLMWRSHNPAPSKASGGNQPVWPSIWRSRKSGAAAGAIC